MVCVCVGEGGGEEGRRERDFQVCLADAAGQTEFRFKSSFLQLTFPKVNKSTKIFNEKKTKPHLGKRKNHKGERQHHRKEAMTIKNNYNYFSNFNFYSNYTLNYN